MRLLAILVFAAATVPFGRSEQVAGPRLSVGEVMAAFGRTQKMKFPMPAKVYWREAGFPADDSKLFLGFGGDLEFRWMRYRLTDVDKEGRVYTLTLFFTPESSEQKEWMVYRVLFAEEHAEFDSPRAARILVSPGFYFDHFDRWREEMKKPNQSSSQRRPAHGFPARGSFLVIESACPAGLYS